MFLKLLRGPAKLVAVLLGLYGGWCWWDIHQLSAFCREVRPGVAVDSLPELARQHGVDVRWLARGGIYDERRRDWFMPVPATSTMGEVACAIHHDQTSVVSAAMSGR